jgi:D-alanyl-D-alanine carboxypeptidase
MAKNKKMLMYDGNQAAAHIAYMLGRGEKSFAQNY